MGNAFDIGSGEARKLKLRKFEEALAPKPARGSSSALSWPLIRSELSSVHRDRLAATGMGQRAKTRASVGDGTFEIIDQPVIDAVLPEPVKANRT